MSEEKYRKYIMTELKTDGAAGAGEDEPVVNILRMDAQNTPGAFFMNCDWWLQAGRRPLMAEHSHDCGEILGFFGSDYRHAHDLGGEIEFWLEDRKVVLTSSTLVYLPPGMQHGSLHIKRVDKPIFHFSTLEKGFREALDPTRVTKKEQTEAPGSVLDYRRYVVSDLYIPPGMSPEFIKKMEEWNHLILWIDHQLVPGAFQMNCCWFDRVPPEQQFHEHRHEVSEIIGLFGSDPARPQDMGAEVEFWMEDEQYIIDRSCLIFVPAGVKHCPLYIKRVDRPIFHFTVVTSPLYAQIK